MLPHQEEAVGKLKVGNILLGGVGSGKTYTSLFFYLKYFKHLPLLIITIPKKRDDGDWEQSTRNLKISDSLVTVDSWNNIKKYKDIRKTFIIFDEQKASGYGTWAKTFITIASNNPWILLSATPGDKWEHYAPAFIANGFFKNITEFRERHIEYDNYVSYPKIKKYLNTARLEKMRRFITVPMPVERHTTRHRIIVDCEYDTDIYETVFKKRWNVYEDKPIENSSQMQHTIRKVVNNDATRKWAANWIMQLYHRIIIFYNYDFELGILIDICQETGLNYRQYNGHAHETVDDLDSWVYLVHYTSGAEAWENTECNTMMFYSLNYSWRIMEQCEGRIDRLNTPFKDLEYYYLESNAPIDRDIRRAVKNKKDFNATLWLRRNGVEFEKRE